MNSYYKWKHVEIMDKFLRAVRPSRQTIVTNERPPQDPVLGESLFIRMPCLAGLTQGPHTNNLFIRPGELKGHPCWDCVRDHHVTSSSGLPTWYGNFQYASKNRQTLLDIGMIQRRTTLQDEFGPRRRSLRLEQGGTFSCSWVLLILKLSILRHMGNTQELQR